MFNPIAANYHANIDEEFAVRIEAVSAHDGLDEPYYRMKFGNNLITVFLTDVQRRQIIDALSSAEPLPKSDAQIDAPDCPDSPDGQHHAVPMGVVDDAPLIAECYYCGEKPTEVLRG